MTSTAALSQKELTVVPNGAPSGEWQASKRKLVQELFGAIAPRYDRFNRVASMGLDRGWRRNTIQQAAITPDMRVLDVCTGTGDLAFLASRQTGARGLVVGVDFTWPMLQGAAQRSRQYAQNVAVGGMSPHAGRDHQRGRGRFRGAPQTQAGTRVEWLQADALALPFGDGTFDRIVMGFSTRNLADLSAGMRELLRVLKPQGQLWILETGWPSNPLLRVAYWIFLATVARGIGWIITGKLWPFTYFARSVRGFLTPAAFADLVRGCEAQVRHQPLSGGLASLYQITKGYA